MGWVLALILNSPSPTQNQSTEQLLLELRLLVKVQSALTSGLCVGSSQNESGVCNSQSCNS